MLGLSIGDIYNEFRKIIRISGRLKNICHRLTSQGTQTESVGVPFLVFCNRRHCIRPPPLLNNDWINQIRFNPVQQLKRDGIRHIYRI